MRKPLFVLMAATALVLAACGKDDDKPTPEPTPDPTPANADDGIYAPQAKIRAINNPDGTSETWLWDADTLLSVDNAAYCGGGDPMLTFSYQPGTLRLTGVSLNRDDLRATMQLAYNGTALRNASVVVDDNGTSRPVDISFTHNAAGRVSQADITVANADAIALMPLGLRIMNMQLPIELPDIDPSMLTANSVRGILDWDGDNVRQLVGTLEMDLNLTVGDLPLELIEQFAGSAMAEYIHTSLADSQIPLHVTITDTIDYTYEPATYINPLTGFVGRVEMSTVSAQNVQSEHSHGAMRIEGVANNIPIVGTLPIDRTIPMPDTTIRYTYEYENTLPLLRTDHEGNTTGFVY